MVFVVLYFQEYKLVYLQFVSDIFILIKENCITILYNLAH